VSDHATRPDAAIADPDLAVATLTFEAMMEMIKIDIAAIEAVKSG
jgi:predicted 3-demethylubiquinone-9 3-methyltransferase (glyoxalase superfamily)